MFAVLQQPSCYGRSDGVLVWLHWFGPFDS